MEKVAIVSCYFKNNYGSQLQAFATQKAIEKLGYETETIDIKKNVDFANGKKKYYASQVLNFNFIKTKLGMLKLKMYKKMNKKLARNISIRDKKFNDFKNIYNMSEEYKDYNELKDACQKYDSVVVGSDQLWLPVNVVSDYYTLNWVPDEINKVSYATSFGISSIPNKYEENYKAFLKRINYLSVRESAGVELVESLIGKNAELVCDPTILLEQKDWLEIQEKDKIVQEPYILCYFLGNSIEYRKFAEKIKEKTNCKIVALNHCDEYVKYDDSYADEILYDIGPGEFVNLIRNADFVCTDSFHGTVFSLLNNKKFFTFRRFNSKSKMSTNSRVESLLDKVNLKDRLIEGTENIDDMLKKKVDYAKVNNILEDFRNESYIFLKNALLKKNDIEEG